MSEHSKWASFVRAHRLSKNLNQGEFARVMQVSQQTVSRWESGAQTPDPAIQDVLRKQLRITALNSLAFWKHRVSAARTHDLLIARDMSILAASKSALQLFQGDGLAIIGSRLTEVLPYSKMAVPHPPPMNSIEQLRDIGFFDGLIRSVRLSAEWHMQSGSCACNSDIWPILTSEQTILGHISGAPTPIPADPNEWRGIRVQSVDIRLNKDG